jgi:hypothetical protein
MSVQPGNVAWTMIDGVQQKHVAFWCPGCAMNHSIVHAPGRWDWNGDLVKPTFSPSILVQGTIPVTDEEIARIMRGEHVEPVPFRCHSYVEDGNIRFLDDCTHALAGKTVPLPFPDVPEQESPDDPQATGG